MNIQAQDGGRHPLGTGGEAKGYPPSNMPMGKSHGPPEVRNGVPVPGEVGRGTGLSLDPGESWGGMPQTQAPLCSPQVPSHHSPSQEKGYVDE